MYIVHTNSKLFRQFSGNSNSAIFRLDRVVSQRRKPEVPNQILHADEEVADREA